METRNLQLALLLFCLLTLGLTAASCKRSNSPANGNGEASNSNQAAGTTSKTPPFATKEPERYQALRVITTTGGPEGSRSDDRAIQELHIARDGDRRREEFEFAGSKASYLILPSGSYLLWPEKKIYADLTSERETSSKENSVPPDISPDKLLNEERPEAVYEDLGSESIDGRQTHKYRVVIKGQLGAAKETPTENLVWIDEKLGMPIRTEMNSKDSARVVVELRDINETVDDGAFDLPQDYRKVSEKEFFASLRGVDGGK